MTTDTDHLQSDLLNLVTYMIASAQGLADEPADYGTFRLIDSAGRLLALMKTRGWTDPFLDHLLAELDQEREGNMDNESQQAHLAQLLLEIAQEMQKSN